MYSSEWLASFLPTVLHVLYLYVHVLYLYLHVYTCNFVIQESLDEVTVKDMLEGDNMYTCSKCQKKVRAEKRSDIILTVVVGV